ncbi:hypothetical protein BS47DRAFT_1359173 [Hydnum rufescens UP504]|uniref:Uncharacterized protein n=1 Tax=Hydnum rufescens UP504 TaxID=1448309 RepID=A0A9P6E0R1_9AGAM|nr:hypothetical protein BS47DRAFT_1359173 [Hydnum rufescens UP504]
MYVTPSTGKLQLANVGLQQPTKHHIRCQCLEDLVAYVEDELCNGAWGLCTVKNWNLSYECLTSAEAVSTVAECYDEDLSFVMHVTLLSDSTNIPGDIDHPESTDFATLTKESMTLKTFKMDGNLFITNKSDNGYQIVSPFDGELTDVDANGETDPEAASKSNVEGEDDSDSDEKVIPSKAPTSQIWSSHYQTPDIQVPQEFIR